MLHVMPRTREGQRTKVTKKVPAARITHTSNNNASSRRKTRGKTGSEHAKQEKRWVKREPRKYVKCHVAHTGRTTNKGGQRGMWILVECK